MARSLRIEFSGGLYHVTSRGNKKECIFYTIEDRELFLSLIEIVCKRFGWNIYSYCLMSNHYHLLVETPLPNLSRGMHYLNGVYTQKFNRIHERVGHVFQGRYHSVIVDQNSYFLELSRYIVLNPVRAKLVSYAGDWKWSSYLATCGEAPLYTWLKIDRILSNFGSYLIKQSFVKYKQFVSEGILKDSPWKNLKNQIYLGEEKFVSEMMSTIDSSQSLTNVPKTQYKQSCDKQPIGNFCKASPNRDQSIKEAYESGAYTMRELGEYFGLHFSRISKIVNKEKGKP